MIKQAAASKRAGILFMMSFPDSPSQRPASPEYPVELVYHPAKVNDFPPYISSLKINS
jgi:hypothetical protein